MTEVLNPAPPELVERSKLRADGCTGTPVVVFYANPKAASDAVAKLHGRAVKPGKKGKGGGGGREDADAPAINLWARQVSGDGAHVKRWRIIVRNLPFQVGTLEHGVHMWNWWLLAGKACLSCILCNNRIATAT